MLYDLIITKIDKPASRSIIARLLAADLSTSIQKALSELENLPTVYKRGLTEKDFRELALKLNKMGATCQVIESKTPGDTFKPKRDSVEDYLKSEIKTDGTGTPNITNQKQEPPQKTASIKSQERKKRAQEKMTFLKSVQKAKSPRKKEGRSLVIIFVIIGVALLIAFFSAGNKKQIKIKRSDALVKKTSNKTSKGKRSKKAKKNNNINKEKASKSAKSKRTPTNPTQKKASSTYTDSARHSGDDTEQAIKFYKIAISFNRYNLKAWQGLIVAYRNAGKPKEAAEAKERMEELFGEEIFSIKEIVDTYGELSDYSQDNNNVCRIEYRSRLSKRTELERETYLLMRAILSHKRCASISLYAATRKGSGMLVRIGTRAFPSSVSEYKKRAVITFVE